MSRAAIPSSHDISETALQRQLRRLTAQEVQPWLHQEVGQRMAERLAVIKLKPETSLQWPGWLGHSSELLAEAYPAGRQLWAEPDEAARQRAEQRLHRGWWQRLRAAPTVPQLAVAGAEACCQLLWSNMALHAAPDHPALIGQWHRALAVDGFLMFSCLGPDSFKELTALYAAEGWGQPMPAWTDMHDLGDMMVEAGFADPVMDQEVLRLTWRDPRKLLLDLRQLGGNVAALRFAGLRTPRWRERLLAGLEGLRGPDGLITMSLELVYGHAFKPQPRARVAEETRVSLQDMRGMLRKPGNT